jgi:uncharacterized protein YjiS (DUF1127 family)
MRLAIERMRGEAAARWLQVLQAEIQRGARRAREAIARYQQRRREEAEHEMLRWLDDRTLRDIGLERGTPIPTSQRKGT